MSRFYLGHHSNGSFNQEEIDFSEFVSFVKGTSIVSLADWNDYIEIGLSENLMIRIIKDNEPHRGLDTTVLSTLNSGVGSPVRAQLINDGETPSVGLLEERLYNLRQVYAILLLLEAGRADELVDLLQKDQKADVEQELLSADEWLHIQAAGPGSLWVVLESTYKKITSSPQFALNMLSVVYGEGRQLLLRRARATTIKQEEEAEAARDARFIKLIQQLEKTKNPAAKELIEHRLRESLILANPQIAETKIAGLLPKPDNDPSP